MFNDNYLMSDASLVQYAAAHILDYKPFIVIRQILCHYSDMSDSQEIITIPYKYIPRPYQVEALDAFDNPMYNRFLLRQCRRAGKDKLCINLVLKAALERVGAYFYMFPSYAQARKVLWEGRDAGSPPMKFMEHIPECLKANVNNNEMKLTLTNGSIIRLVGSDNYDSLMGTNPLGIIFSEFALQGPEVWGFFEPILTQNKGWAVFQGTPRGRNHMYTLEQAALKNPRWFVQEVQTLFPDLPNYYPVCTPEDIEEVRKGGASEELIEQEYGASYAAGAKGNYYSDQIIKARQDGRIGKFPYNDHLYVDTFWDLGWNDDTTVWFKQRDGNANIFIDYFEGNTKDIAFYVQMLKEKGYRYRTHFLPHDAAGGKLQSSFSHADLLRNLCQQASIGWDVVIAPRPEKKQYAIDRVRSRFSTYFFNEPLIGDSLTKLSLYHRRWDKVNQVFADQPVHDWCSHAADALTTEALTSELQETSFATLEPKMIIDFNPIDYGYETD